MDRSEKKCVLCKIIKGDVKADKVFESDSFIAFRDANPISEGHTLIVPKKHWVTILDIPEKFGVELLKTIKKVANKLLDEGLGKGFNLIMNNLECAGQVVGHGHVHVIPRKDGDGIRFLTRR